MSVEYFAWALYAVLGLAAFVAVFVFVVPFLIFIYVKAARYGYLRADDVNNQYAQETNQPKEHECNGRDQTRA